MAAAESYPEDLRYHAEHDWARLDGDELNLVALIQNLDAL